MQLLNALDFLRERVTKLETLIGGTPNEGLRKEVSEIRDLLQSMERRFWLFSGGGLVVVFIIVHFFSRT